MQATSRNLEVVSQHFVDDFSAKEFSVLQKSYKCQLDRVEHPYPPTQALPFFAPRRWRDICQVLGGEIFQRLESAASRYFMANGTAPWSIPSHLKPAVRPSVAGQSTHPVIRVDAFCDPSDDHFSILEINTADPSAFAWNDFMLRSLYQHQPFADYCLRMNYTADFMARQHLSIVLHRYREECRILDRQSSPRPTIALSIAPESTVLFDFVALKDLYQSYGVQTILAKPSDFKWKRERDEVRVGDTLIDIIVRDTLDEVFFPEGETTTGDLPDILAESSICVMNPTASTLGDQKSWLADLWQDLRTPSHTPAAKLLAEAMLETHIFSKRYRSMLINNRTSWVLKPSSGFGGHGIMIGAGTNPDVWADHIDAVSHSQVPHIIQKHRSAGMGFLTTDATTTLSQRNAVFSFWLFEGKYVGAFARLSQDEIINTHQGGALVPVVWTP